MEDNTEHKNSTSSTGIVDLCKNYKEMNETGKRKLEEVSEKILDIWKTVNADFLH